MRVICIKTDHYYNNDDGRPDGIAVTKGSIYHVVKALTSKEVLEYCRSKAVEKGVTYNRTSFAAGDWYELLEVRGYHHYSNFLEIPSDEVVEIKQVAVGLRDIQDYKNIFNSY